MRAVAVSCVLLAALVVCPRAVQAQPSDQKAVAEALFEEGRARLVEKDYAAACPKLAESQRLDPSIGTALYLAACYEKVGKTASAWALFREAEELAAREGDTKRGALAHARAEALAENLSKLVIVVPDSARVEGLTVTRDGTSVSAPIWGTRVPIDPGAHVVEASAPGRQPFRAAIDVAGPLVEVVVPALEAAQPAEPVKPGVVAPADRTMTSGGSSVQRNVGIALGAVGVAGIITGIAFTLRTSALVSDASSKGCDTEASPVRCPDNPDGRSGLASMDEARQTWRPMSIVALVGGVVLTGVGGFLFFTAPPSSASASRALVVTPRFGAGSGGLFVEGAL